jgi:predicted neuraminidase
VLFPAPGGELWLLHTAQHSGHQNTSVVRRRLSRDQGLSWEPTETLADAPAGTFVRQPIHVHTDGSWLLPVFHCRAQPGQAWDGSHDDSGVLRSADQGAAGSALPCPAAWAAFT